MESKRWLGSAAAVLAALLAVAPATAAMIPDYGVSELSLGGASYPAKMADNATVIGVSKEASGNNTFAFISRGGTTRKAVLDDTAGGGGPGTASWPTNVNASGEIVGRSNAYSSDYFNGTYSLGYTNPALFYQSLDGSVSYEGQNNLSLYMSRYPSEPKDINNVGVATFQANNKNYGAACVLVDVTMKRAGAPYGFTMEVPGSPPGYSNYSGERYCTQLNNYSHLVSIWQFGGGYRGQFVRYLGNGTLSSVDMGSIGPAGWFSTMPYFLNDADRAAGQSQDAAFDLYAFSYDASTTTMTKLSLGGNYSDVAGVSRNGLVIGSSYLPGNTEMHAFVYDGSSVSDLGTLGGKNSFAVAVNNAGYVVGNSQVAGSNEMHAFLYNGSYVTDLGTLGGPSSHAKAINGNGQVVGTSSSGASAPTRAFLYSDGLMVDINSLVPPASGYTVVGAESIDDDGKILAVAVKNGKTLAVLLEPSGPPIQR